MPAPRTGSDGMSDASNGPRLYRIILPARDIKATAAWYEDLLQLRGEFVWQNRFYLHCGPVILALVEPEPGVTPRPNQDHVYLAVADLQAFHERATRLGVLDAEMGAIAPRPWGE